MSGDGGEVQPGGGRSPGLLRGLATTARAMFRPVHTQEYPDVLPALPPRSRGVIALLQENCTVCMLCARECPDWCIYIDSHKETLPAAEGGRERQRNVLDRFAIDFSLCMYCGICIEVCPFDALFWSPEFEYAELDIRDLLHEKERLSGWMGTVPPPPAPDAGAPEPKEVAASRKPARPERPAPAARTDRPAKKAAAAPDAAVPPDAEAAPAAEVAPPTEVLPEAPATEVLPATDAPTEQLDVRPTAPIEVIEPTAVDGGPAARPPRAPRAPRTRVVKGEAADTPIAGPAETTEPAEPAEKTEPDAPDGDPA